MTLLLVAALQKKIGAAVHATAPVTAPGPDWAPEIIAVSRLSFSNR